MDFEKVCKESIDKLIADGFVQKAIEEQLKKTINSILNDVLGNWSSFNKEMKNKLEELLKVNLTDLTLKQYGSYIVEQIDTSIKAEIESQSNQEIVNAIKNLLSDNEDSMTLSAIIKEILNSEYHYQEYSDLEYDSGSLIIEEGFAGNKCIYIDTTDTVYHKSDYAFKIYLDKEYRITNIGMKSKDSYITLGYSVERFLRQLYLSRKKVVFDKGEDPSEYNLDIGSVVFGYYD